MSLQGIINNVRERPVHHQKMIAFSTSAAVTLVIALAWVANLPAQWAAVSSPVPAANQPAIVELSVVNPSPIVNSGTDANNQNSTPTIQQSLNQGGQILSSLKSDISSIGNLFAGIGPGSSAPAASPLPGATTYVPVASSSLANNPYSNLKYYVSNGVLISDPAGR